MAGEVEGAETAGEVAAQRTEEGVAAVQRRVGELPVSGGRTKGTEGESVRSVAQAVYAAHKSVYMASKGHRYID